MFMDQNLSMTPIRQQQGSWFGKSATRSTRKVVITSTTRDSLTFYDSQVAKDIQTVQEKLSSGREADIGERSSYQAAMIAWPSLISRVTYMERRVKALVSLNRIKPVRLVVIDYLGYINGGGWCLELLKGITPANSLRYRGFSGLGSSRLVVACKTSSRCELKGKH
jgi:hypothetical protein